MYFLYLLHTTYKRAKSLDKIVKNNIFQSIKWIVDVCADTGVVLFEEVRYWFTSLFRFYKMNFYIQYDGLFICYF